MAKEKKYCGGGTEKVFDNGGSVINCWIDTRSIQANDRGYISFSVGRRRSPSDKGATHWIAVNDYEKKEQKSEERAEAERQGFQPNDSLPF